MGRNRPAAFDLYTDDVLSSSKIALMTDSEFRAYVYLWCHCWNLGCVLPKDPEALLRLAGMARSPNRHPDGHIIGHGKLNGDGHGHEHGPITPLVLSCFVEHPEKPGCLTHPKLWKQYKKWERLSIAGKQGADGKWHGHQHGV